MEAADVKQPSRLAGKQAEKDLLVIYLKSGSNWVCWVINLAVPECLSGLNNVFNNRLVLHNLFAMLTHPMNGPEEMYWTTIKSLMK